MRVYILLTSSPASLWLGVEGVESLVVAHYSLGSCWCLVRAEVSRFDYGMCIINNIYISAQGVNLSLSSSFISTLCKWQYGI